MLLPKISPKPHENETILGRGGGAPLRSATERPRVGSVPVHCLGVGVTIAASNLKHKRWTLTLIVNKASPLLFLA